MIRRPLPWLLFAALVLGAMIVLTLPARGRAADKLERGAAKPAPPAAPASPAPDRSTGTNVTPPDRAPEAANPAPAPAPTITPPSNASSPNVHAATAPSPRSAAPAPSPPTAAPAPQPPKLAPPDVHPPSVAVPATPRGGQPAAIPRTSTAVPRGAQPVDRPPQPSARAADDQTPPTATPVAPRGAQPTPAPRGASSAPVGISPPRSADRVPSPSGSTPPGWQRWPRGGAPPVGRPVVRRLHPRRHVGPWPCNPCCFVAPHDLICGPGTEIVLPTLILVESLKVSGRQASSEIIYSYAAGLARIDHPNGRVLLDERGRIVSFYDRDTDSWSQSSLDEWASSVDSTVEWTRAHSRPPGATFAVAGEAMLVTGFECVPYRLSIEVDTAAGGTLQLAQALWVTQDVETTPEIYATYQNALRLFDDQWLDVAAERPPGIVLRTRAVRLVTPLVAGEGAEITEATIVDIGYRLEPLTYFQPRGWHDSPVVVEPAGEP